MSTPDNLKYTREHEWVAQDGDRVRVGITDHAQRSLGDVVYVSLPDVGQQVQAGQPCGEVESTKSVSDIYAPLTGEVLSRNEALLSDPSPINADPYGAGWLIEVSSAPEHPAELLSAEEYRTFISPPGQ